MRQHFNRHALQLADLTFNFCSRFDAHGNVTRRNAGRCSASGGRIGVYGHQKQALGDRARVYGVRFGVHTRGACWHGDRQ